MIGNRKSVFKKLPVRTCGFAAQEYSTKRCDIYVTALVEAGNIQGAFLINGTTVAIVGYAWTAINLARHMLLTYFALSKGDVFQLRNRY